VFPELEELRLGPADLYSARGPPNLSKATEASDVIEKEGEKKRKTSLLNVKQFPKLTTLHLHSPSNTTMEAISRKGLFPPLQKLHIYVSSPYWLRIIQLSAETLDTLIVEAPFGFVNQVPTSALKKETTLPRLSHLAYNNFDGSVRPLPFPVLKTPVLKSYEEVDVPGVAPWHDDLSSVTSLVFGNPESVNWEKAPRVTYIQLRTTPGQILDNIVSLYNNEDLCTDLVTVDCIQVAHSLDVRVANTAKLAVQKRSVATGKSIELNYYTLSEYLQKSNDQINTSMVGSSAPSLSVRHSHFAVLYILCV